jgi:nucleotide-binding universal stress UspA family protein
MSDENKQEEAKNYSGKAAELARKEGLSVESIAPVGRSHDVIIEAAGGRSVDPIVVGTYGKTGAKKLLMGSSTVKVIKAAGCAVLVVTAS